jgi:hypothetical protein
MVAVTTAKVEAMLVRRVDRKKKGENKKPILRFRRFRNRVTGFAGRDATKAFFDLCFTEECLKTAGDLSSLSEKQLREVKSWRDFYFDELRYPFVGYVKTTHANPQPDLDKYKQ